jgi:alpha-galactosidase
LSLAGLTFLHTARHANFAILPCLSSRTGVLTLSFQSSSGYSSHYHNPFVALVPPTTTDHVGEAYGFSFIWSGSFSIDIEKSPANDRTRVLVGLNPLHLDWPLAPSATFTSPEVATVYEPVAGLGGMSRSYHKLYRNHLSRSSWTHKERPVLINNWEATYFDFTADTLTAFAKRAAGLGIRMFVMDDGWFGDKKPRVNDDAGLGDWVPNPKRFPQGLDPFVQGITKLQTGADHAMRFGIWVEPEMVNPTSELFDAHPDWAMQVQGYDLTEQRQQLVLDLSKVEVQDYIISSMSTLLSSSAISYVKWDNNRGIHEVPSSATAHAYILGLYRVIDTLCTRFPDVLFEGCASGGGRFDPGLLHYWCQSWTSDDSDALERLPIQFGTSLVYPPSSMGCHVSACPNEQVHRTTPLAFRAHVAMMGGSFGFELDLAHLSADEQAAIPGIVDLAERVNPYVIHGDMYRLADPQNNNWPAVMYTNKGDAVVLAYQIRMVPRGHPPALRLQGLEADATYELRQEGEDKVEQVKGAALMAQGIWADWRGDYASHVFWLKRVEGKANGAQ